MLAYLVQKGAISAVNRKILAWNKENIELAQAEAERLLTKHMDDDDKRMTYGIIRATLWAVGFILDEMHKGYHFTDMADKKPTEDGNYVVCVRDKETGHQGLTMDYWYNGGWDDYQTTDRYEVVSYKRCFEEEKGTNNGRQI